MRVLIQIFALILLLINMSSTCQEEEVENVDLINLSTQLAAYANVDEYNQLRAEYVKNVDWVVKNTQESDNKRYIYLYVALTQAELTTRNQAIKRLMVSKLTHLSFDLLQKPLDHENNQHLRDVTLELFVARAKLRAKVTMLQANEFQWICLYEMMTSGYEVYHEQQLARLFNKTMPRESLSVSEELTEQNDLINTYLELKRAAHPREDEWWTESRVLQVIDKTLDEYFECGKLCNELRVVQWTNAAPLGGSFQVNEWIIEHLSREPLESMDVMRKLISDHLHLTSVYELAKVPLEKMEKFRSGAIESLGSFNK